MSISPKRRPDYLSPVPTPTYEADTKPTYGGRPPGDFPPTDPNRKFRAKRINEHIKSIYAIGNTLAAAVIGAAFIIPAVNGSKIASEVDTPGWVFIGVALHLFGHGIVWWQWRKED